MNILKRQKLATKHFKQYLIRAIINPAHTAPYGYLILIRMRMFVIGLSPKAAMDILVGFHPVIRRFICWPVIRENGVIITAPPSHYDPTITESGFWDVFCGEDADADGLPDVADNCPHVYNPDQMDNDNDEIGDACETATVIHLSSFTATPKSIKVILEWSTESETDNAGFNIYRAEAANGKYRKINPFLIPAQGSSTQGASYEFIDKDVQNRKTYYYKLEDIDLNGKSTMHGPVRATPRWIFGLRK
jgi:hypothetical protein